MGIKNYENLVMNEISDKVVVLLGKTGVGKSSFINCITNKNDCKIGKSFESCTQKLQHVDLLKDGYNFYFVDTPGLDDAKGDEKNINQLNELKRKYPRINVFIICIDFHEPRFSKSLEIAIKKFMEIFPCQNFWDHVLIVRTKAERGRRFEEMKRDVEGQLLNGILYNTELITFMNFNKIKIPSELKEFYVDSFPNDLDKDTLEEYDSILEKIKVIHPIYKEVKEEEKEEVYEEKEDDSTFIHIITNKHITFKDFDDKEHEVIQKVREEKYNLDGIRPVLNEIKREQSKEPRGKWCYSSQYETHYYLVKYYEIGGNKKRVQIEIDNRYEPKDLEEIIEDSNGEDYKKSLEKEYLKGCYQNENY